MVDAFARLVSLRGPTFPVFATRALYFGKGGCFAFLFLALPCLGIAQIDLWDVNVGLVHGANSPAYEMVLGFNISIQGTPAEKFDSLSVANVFGQVVNVPLTTGYVQTHPLTGVTTSEDTILTGSSNVYQGSVVADTDILGQLGDLDYTVTFNGGTYDGRQDSFHLDSSLVLPIPTVSTTAFTAITDWNVDHQLTLAPAFYAMPAGSSDGARSFTITHLDSGESITDLTFSAQPWGTDTWFIPAGTIAPGTMYQFSFFDVVHGPAGDLTFAAYDSSYGATATAVPETAAFASISGFGALLAAGLKRRYRKV